MPGGSTAQQADCSAMDRLPRVLDLLVKGLVLGGTKRNARMSTLLKADIRVEASMERARIQVLLCRVERSLLLTRCWSCGRVCWRRS